MKAKQPLWSAKKSPEENARARLPELAAEFFAGGRKAAIETSATALHDFRLNVKRFRYMIEAFRPLYGPGLETRLEALRKVQQLLGALNDCATTGRMLRASGHAATEEVQSVLVFVEKRGQAKTRKFRKYWTEEFDREGEEAKWVTYLARQASGARARKK